MPGSGWRWPPGWFGMGWPVHGPGMSGQGRSGPVSGAADLRGLVPVYILGKGWVGEWPPLVPGVGLGSRTDEGPGSGKSGSQHWVGVGPLGWEAGLIGLGRLVSTER